MTEWHKTENIPTDFNLIINSSCHNCNALHKYTSTRCNWRFL